MRHTHYHPITGMYYRYDKDSKRYYFYSKGSWLIKSRKKFSGMKQGFVKL